jgi:hypothetical protein
MAVLGHAFRARQWGGDPVGSDPVQVAHVGHLNSGLRPRNYGFRAMRHLASGGSAGSPGTRPYRVERQAPHARAWTYLRVDPPAEAPRPMRPAHTLLTGTSGAEGHRRPGWSGPAEEGVVIALGAGSRWPMWATWFRVLGRETAGSFATPSGVAASTGAPATATSSRGSMGVEPSMPSPGAGRQAGQCVPLDVAGAPCRGSVAAGDASWGAELGLPGSGVLRVHAFPPQPQE